MKKIFSILIFLSLALNLNATTHEMYLKYITKSKVKYSGATDPKTYTTVLPGEIWVSEHNKKNSTDYVVKEYKNNSWATVKTINVFNHNKEPRVIGLNKGVNNAN
jgi:hypothetical protein